jgi:uncharacterized protein
MSISIRPRQDGFQNVLSGLNTAGLDRTASTFHNGGSWRRGLERFWASRYSYYDYADIYAGSGIAQKIIDRPADDCLQRGVTIEGDEEGSIYDEYDRLSVYTQMSTAIRWTRLYGGAVILIIVKDGGELWEPLNYNSVEEVVELKVYDITCIKPTERTYSDPFDLVKFGQIEYYDLTPPGVNTFLVHETRMIFMSGEPLPLKQVSRQGINWVGRSVLEGCLDDLSRYDQALQWTIRLLERKQQGIYSMEGLGDLFAQGMDDVVSRRINLVDLVRGNLNSVVVDKNDDYNIENLGLDGVQSVIQEYQTALAASSNIPVVILFGKSTTGLNATGAGDLESYYGMVSHIQQVIAKPCLEKLTAMLYIQSTYTDAIPDKWKIEFNPLWVPSETEIATTNKTNQEANSIEVNTLMTLMNNSIISPEELRRIVVNKYSEYEFVDELPSFEGDVNYAEGVDPADLEVPDDEDVAPGERKPSNVIA